MKQLNVIEIPTMQEIMAFVQAEFGDEIAAALKFTQSAGVSYGNSWGAYPEVPYKCVLDRWMAADQVAYLLAGVTRPPQE